MLELRRSLVIQEKGEAIARSMVHLQQIIITINLKHKINAYFPATSRIWTTVRSTLRKAQKKEANFLLKRIYIMVVINQFQCHKMQELAMTDEYARFVRRIILLVYMVTLQSRKLETIILVYQMEHKM